MFTEDIIKIIEKYQDNNSEVIVAINENIEHIEKHLRAFNNSLSSLLIKLTNDYDNINNNADEILKDSQIIREYINSINKIVIKSNVIEDNEISDEICPNNIQNTKSVKLFLCEDNICPICNCSMEETKTIYTKTIDNKQTRQTLNSYRCNCCNRFFVINFALDDINIQQTNLIINEDYHFCKIPKINIHSLIVLKNTLYCSSNHKTKDLIAKIPTINKIGELFYIQVDASYCFDCDRFTILKNDFNSIKDIVMCKIIDETTNNFNNSSDEFEIEQKQSILSNYGYNVQSKKNLTSEQRHIILSSVIEANIINKRDIVNHISTLIERGSKIDNWKNATLRWTEDREFVSAYKNGDLPEIIFNEIILKYNNGKITITDAVAEE